MVRSLHNVSVVVSQDLCTGCGTCVACCPEDAIQMCETPGGLLLPQVDSERCTECGLCMAVCPGWKVETICEETVDPFKGVVRRACFAYAVDPAVRLDGQSGGVVTALLEHLLDTGQIRAAIVTGMVENGRLRPRPFVAETGASVREAWGSKYCPAAANAVLADVTSGTEPLAVVGLGCQMHGLMRAGLNAPKALPPVALKIGLVCEGLLTYAAIDDLIKHAGVKREEVESFRFKSKHSGGWPGDTQIGLREGATHYVDGSVRMSHKAGFRVPRCQLCWDKMNVMADLVVGDPWGLRADKLGVNILIIRTEAGERALQSALDAGVLVVEDLDVEDIFRGQHIEDKRRDWSCAMQAWQGLGQVVPELAIADAWRGSVNRPCSRRAGRAMQRALCRTLSKTKEDAMRLSLRELKRRSIGAVLKPSAMKRMVRQLIKRSWKRTSE